MSEDYLFVYGTLRRDTSSDMYRLLARHGEFVSDANFQGRLYWVDYYPGVIPSDDPEDQVKGEVYLVNRPDYVLRILDEYEECGPGFPEPTEYKRRREMVRLDNGESCLAWIYIFNRPVEGLERIVSGDFFGDQADNRRRDG